MSRVQIRCMSQYFPISLPCLIKKSYDNIFLVANFMFHFILGLFIALSPTTQSIEKAFLQNNPRILYSLFSSESSINISLPEPISFSDQVSREQAFFLFKKIFSSFNTLEFYPEEEFPFSSENQSFIFKARWSFKDNRNNNQYPIHIFFYLIKEKLKNTWKIIEIKAEKI